ncbi:hypothetical protein UABAM_02592 [Candidatus Uabimicrobium amorphum]|uniref:Uncharacterized protein n=1 Tax=Uabimicrobium amorphum TaxID=2596890 RepID=A0A5S9IMM7_UABAM|nr:hypothetical protein UABAM_02592 [Candidatus Uabimicrobium amorphum]
MIEEDSFYFSIIFSIFFSHYFVYDISAQGCRNGGLLF